MSPKVSDHTQLQGEDITIIETKIDESLLLATEELIDDEHPAIPKKIGAETYEVVVEERSIRYNTIVKLSEAKIKNQSCNCIQWRSNGVCHHVIVAIYAIRREIANAEKLQAKKKRRQSSRKNVIDRLIKEVSSDELALFIKAYSTKDKVFKLMLQARFVDQLTDDELSGFIESTFPVLTKANEKVTPSKISIFLQVVEILDAQFKNYISQKDYIDGYKLNFLLLKKSFYIKSKLKTERPKFDATHRLLINNFIETLNLVEAPEYREYIFKELKTLLGTSYISANTQEERELWLTIYKDSTRQHILDKLIAAYRSHHHNDLDSAYFILMLELLMASPTAQLKMIAEADLQTAYRILQLLQRHREIGGAIALMKTYFTSKSLSNPLARLILNNIREVDAEESMIEACIGYYVKYKHDLYLLWLKDNSDSWAAISSRITNAIKSNNDRFLEIQFHLANEDIDSAILAIKALNEWKTIIEFDFILYDSHPEIVLEIYTSHLHSYLEDHFGLKARDYVQQVFQRAYYVGKEKLRRKLESFITANFADRDLY